MEEMYMNVKNDQSSDLKSSTNPTGDGRFYRAAVLCLGLISVFLLIGLISLGVHYHNSERGAAAELSTVKANMTEPLQDCKKELSSLTEERNQLKTGLSSLTREKDQLDASLSSLTAERNQLKTNLSFITAQRDQLNDRLSSFTAEKIQLDAKISSLTEEKDQLLANLSSVNKDKDQLDARLIEMTKDRDRLESLTRKSCPAGWTMFRWSCYILSGRSDSWTNGRSDCQNIGADLVVISSPEEQKFLSGFSTVDTWIGLSDRIQEGKWRWIDGTPQSFMNWNEGEPNDALGGEDCAEMVASTGHRWNDLHCGASLHWICEK